jgi:hypothetical protein
MANCSPGFGFMASVCLEPNNKEEPKQEQEPQQQQTESPREQEQQQQQTEGQRAEDSFVVQVVSEADGSHQTEHPLQQNCQQENLETEEREHAQPSTSCPRLCSGYCAVSRCNRSLEVDVDVSCLDCLFDATVDVEGTLVPEAWLAKETVPDRKPTRKEMNDFLGSQSYLLENPEQVQLIELYVGDVGNLSSEFERKTNNKAIRLGLAWGQQLRGKPSFTVASCRIASHLPASSRLGIIPMFSLVRMEYILMSTEQMKPDRKFCNRETYLETIM